MKFAVLIALVLLNTASLWAHSLQGDFNYKLSVTYGSDNYGGTGVVKFTNRPNGTLIATARTDKGRLAYVGNFTSSGAATITYHDPHYGKLIWRGTWKMTGKKRAIVTVAAPKHQTARSVWSIKGNTVRMSVVHRVKGKIVGRGSGVLRAR